MLARLRTTLALVVVSSLFAAPAFAAGKKDKEAMKLHDQAMDEDYLSVEFDKAETKLKKAAELCGESNCSPEVAGKVGRRCRLRFAQRAVERVAASVERRISQCFGEERTDSLRRSEEEVHRGERPWGWQASGHVVNRRGRTSRGPRRAPSPSPFGQLQPLVLPQPSQM